MSCATQAASLTRQQHHQKDNSNTKKTTASLTRQQHHQQDNSITNKTASLTRQQHHKQDNNITNKTTSLTRQQHHQQDNSIITNKHLTSDNRYTDHHYPPTSCYRDLQLSFIHPFFLPSLFFNFFLSTSPFINPQFQCVQTGGKQPELEAHHSTRPTAGVKNKQRYTSAPPRIHGLDRASFTFSSTSQQFFFFFLQYLPVFIECPYLPKRL